MTNQDRKREKLKNAIIFLIQQNKPISLTRLMYMLYLVDFGLFRDYGQSLTGESYEAWHCGPVLCDVWQKLQKLESAVRIVPVNTQNEASGIKLALMPDVSFSDYYFSGRELRKLKEVSEFDCFAKEKKNDPWLITLQTKGEKQNIDYNLALLDCDEEQKTYIRMVQGDAAAFERILECS